MFIQFFETMPQALFLLVKVRVKKIMHFYNSDYANVMRCVIWYHLYNLKSVKNTDEELLILVKLQALACNFTKIKTPPWVFFTLFKLYKLYQIAQRVAN